MTPRKISWWVPRQKSMNQSCIGTLSRASSIHSSTIAWECWRIRVISHMWGIPSVLFFEKYIECFVSKQLGNSKMDSSAIEGATWNLNKSSSFRRTSVAISKPRASFQLPSMKMWVWASDLNYYKSQCLHFKKYLWIFMGLLISLKFPMFKKNAK